MSLSAGAEPRPLGTCTFGSSRSRSPRAATPGYPTARARPVFGQHQRQGVWGTETPKTQKPLNGSPACGHGPSNPRSACRRARANFSHGTPPAQPTSPRSRRTWTRRRGSVRRPSFAFAWALSSLVCLATPTRGQSPVAAPPPAGNELVPPRLVEFVPAVLADSSNPRSPRGCCSSSWSTSRVASAT